MALIKLIFYAFVFSQAIIFLEASNKNEGISRIKGKKVELELQENELVEDEIKEELKVLDAAEEDEVVVDEVEEEVVEAEKDVVVVDEVEEDVEVVNKVEENIEVNVDEVQFGEEVNILEAEDENAEKDKSDGNLSGGLLDTRSDEERQDELVDNIDQVKDLQDKLHNQFEGEREQEN